MDAPVRGSGDTAGTAPIRLEGPAGAVDLSSGTIIAARHLHLSTEDGARFGLADGGRVTLVVGTAAGGAGDRRATLHDVLVRMGERHATELHLDKDEAHAYGIVRAATATLLIASGPGGRPRREGASRVITARDVDAIAAEGKSVSRGPACIVTPAAIDRAKAFGIWRE